jgi:hypothetical protein
MIITWICLFHSATSIWKFESHTQHDIKGMSIDCTIYKNKIKSKNKNTTHLKHHKIEIITLTRKKYVPMTCDGGRYLSLPII